MKYLAVLLASIIITSCNSESKKSPNPIPKEDHTVILYAFNPSKNDYRTGDAIRSVRDTFKLSITDSSNGKITQEKTWGKDTTYFVAYWDSVRDGKNKPRFDSLGKAIMDWKFPMLPKQFVIFDYNKSW